MVEKELTHLSLFSGIGGLDLAAEWAGFTTVGQCEWAEYPTKVLEKHWPDVPRWKDIRTLTGESFYERTGRRTVDAISGGFPCQPFSVAGKQRGKEDDRYLWPEMVRIIKELRPAWVVGENVAGIVRMALPDILSELEACGYRTRTFLIPACAVGARHRRYRVAIVGHSEHNGLSAATVARSLGETGAGEPEGKDQTGEFEGTGKPGDGEALADTEILNERGLSVREETEKPGPVSGRKDVQHTDSPRRKEQHLAEESDKQGFLSRGCDEGNVRNSASEGFSDRSGKQMGGQGAKEPEPERPDSHVSDTDNGFCKREEKEIQSGRDAAYGICSSGGEQRPAKPGLGGVADGIPGWVDGYWDVEPDIPRIAQGIPHRVDRLKALGNAVAPPQFYPIFKAIADIERTQNK